MRHESLVNEDWANLVARLGGAEALNITARETKAFLRPREITNAVDLLRLILAYCLGERGLRSTAAWATSVGLVDISSVALLYRLRQCGDWLALLVGQVLAASAPKASRGRMIRIIDAITVPKKGLSVQLGYRSKINNLRLPKIGALYQANVPVSIEYCGSKADVANFSNEQPQQIRGRIRSASRVDHLGDLLRRCENDRSSCALLTTDCHRDQSIPERA